MKINKKGQLSIINLMFWFVLVVIGGILTVFLAPFLAQIASSSLGVNDTTARLMLMFIVPMMWIAIIAVLFLYSNPQTLRPYQ